MSKRVDLPSGGYLLIDYAEALTVIDVNSGSFVGRGKQARLEDTITRTNLEAAEEVVNQLRLRDIGGIIVIDFIDMARARNRDACSRRCASRSTRTARRPSRRRSRASGSVEMTRQNVTEGVREIMSRPCPTCDGEGVIKSEETIAIEFEREMRDLAQRSGPEVEAFLVQVNPRVSSQFTGEGARVLHQLEADTGKFFSFEGSEGLPLDHFDVTFSGPRSEVEERAVPWRAGDEVMVEIIEPHMYDVDDAVAKIDGYVISVHGAGPLVGHKRLVRLEEVGRTSATAVLLGEDGEPIESIAADGTAKPRRRAAAAGAGARGRRGRRPRADARA
jgi:ribonuclease G